MTSFDSAELRLKLRDTDIPESLHDGIVRYVCYSNRPGGFLTAVLCNDLSAAVHSASPYNRVVLGPIVIALANIIPAVCWGNPTKFEAWLGSTGARIRHFAKQQAL